MMREARGRLSLPINGEDVDVPSIPHLKCPSCGEIVLRWDDAGQLEEGAFELYRQKYGLLSADEIRSLRERLDLKQAELAQLLRLGANTVSRWEAGRNVQTGAMDVLLRLVRDVPGSLDYLRAHPRREEPSAPEKRVRGREATRRMMGAHAAALRKLAK
jgi:putative zinc finger/helix-turn-helix YgiT family protein